MSDGQDTVNEVDVINSIIQCCGTKLNGAGVKSVFKAVAIGKQSDISVAMKVCRKQEETSFPFDELHAQFYINSLTYTHTHAHTHTYICFRSDFNFYM